jgi:hypothetical protein
MRGFDKGYFPRIRDTCFSVNTANAATWRSSLTSAARGTKYRNPILRGVRLVECQWVLRLQQLTVRVLHIRQEGGASFKSRWELSVQGLTRTLGCVILSVLLILTQGHECVFDITGSVENKIGNAFCVRASAGFADGKLVLT